MKRFLATAVTAAVLATGGVAVAGAATGSNGSGSTTSSGSPAPAGSTEAGAKAAHPRLRAATAAFKVAADTIGVSPAELRKEVMAGKTIAQVAEAHNVDAKTVENAIVTKADARIDQAVTNHRISAERAATLKSKVETRVTQLVEHTPNRATAHRPAAEALGVAAKTIGVTPAQLRDALKNGQSVADVAKAHNVDPQKVIDAIVQAGQQRLEKAAEQFVNRTRANA